ncbi:hypothetical protein PILCRDRAFT_825059 [Piloderma croceum F 1598]|uniref:Uncharacterized protein n=1 Tax=Piloderma croceum (strain F 1598) TaxID=765440 RepID=A0A0C3FD98_PILCF|nr:hypothetical protein PILCRDRAFT_825059 [Piloderma croceum F 1598]
MGTRLIAHWNAAVGFRFVRLYDLLDDLPRADFKTLAASLSHLQGSSSEHGDGRSDTQRSSCHRLGMGLSSLIW